MTTFSAYGDVERVKKIKDYAFVHFRERENALKVGQFVFFVLTA